MVMLQILGVLQEPPAQHREHRDRHGVRNQLLRARQAVRQELHQLCPSRNCGERPSEQLPQLRAVPQAAVQGPHQTDEGLRRHQEEVRWLIKISKQDCLSEATY